MQYIRTYVRTCVEYVPTCIDISFELPSEEELQSSGGIEFNTGRSQIYIPYTAIQHQKNTEGTYMIVINLYVMFIYINNLRTTGSQVPIVNYAAKNLASILPARALK